MMIKNQSKPCVERRFVFQCQLQFSYQWFTHVTNSFQVSNMPKTIILEVLSFYCTRLKLRMEVCVYIYIYLSNLDQLIDSTKVFSQPLRWVRSRPADQRKGMCYPFPSQGCLISPTCRTNRAGCPLKR